MKIEAEHAYAAIATHGVPRPFINVHSIALYKRDARAWMASTHLRHDEDEDLGWARAFKEGWRIKRVKITLDECI